MLDLDTALRDLGDTLNADPPVPPDQIRARATTRRRRRHGLTAAAVAVVVGTGVVAAVAMSRDDRDIPPAGSAGTSAPTGSASTPPPTGSAGTSLPIVREGVLLVRKKPNVLAAAEGAPTPAGVATIFRARIGEKSGCLVLIPPASSGPAGKSRVLILPAGVTWTVRLDLGGLELADGRFVPADTEITMRAVLSARTDTTFTDLCPGTAGFVTVTDLPAAR